MFTPKNSTRSPRTQRRDFLRHAGGGIGMMALQSLLQQERLSAAESPNPAPRLTPHFAPRAKRIIWLFMHGGPSHVDLFDHKPELDALRRQAGSRQLRRGDDAAQGRQESPASPHQTVSTSRRLGNLDFGFFATHGRHG